MEIWMDLVIVLCGDVIRRNSVLSSLSFNLFVIQDLISVIQSLIELRTSSRESISKEQYIECHQHKYGS